MNVWIVSHQDIVSHRMMKQRFKKIFFLIHSCWNTSTLLEKLKKKKKGKRKEKEKRKTFPNDFPQ